MQRGGGSDVRASCSILEPRHPILHSVHLCNSEIDCFRGEDIPGVYFSVLYYCCMRPRDGRFILKSSPIVCQRTTFGAFNQFRWQTFLSEHFSWNQIRSKYKKNILSGKTAFSFWRLFLIINQSFQFYRRLQNKSFLASKKVEYFPNKLF